MARREAFRAISAAAALVALLACAGIAAASDAETHFREGIRLMEAGDLKAACVAFEHSQSEDPAAGTLLNLATCYERDGRRVEAHDTFVLAKTAALARKRDDWVTTATAHVEALERTLGKLTFANGGRSASTVTVDGKRLPGASTGAPIWLERGRHALSFESPGYAPTSIVVDLDGEVVVTMPAAAGVRTTGDDHGAEERRRTLGLVVAGAGAAGLAFGGVALALAFTAVADARKQCVSYPDHCSPAATDANDRARVWSVAATIGFAAGAALAVGGVALWAWPRSTPARPMARVTARARPGGLVLEGSF